ncbi:MAG TPA: TlpA family protein disulfide reductase [Desulfobacteraceae bacterium]|nr:TlpA family protein disulfide reductase [Desulfobacteraceae bacterium]
MRIRSICPLERKNQGDTVMTRKTMVYVGCVFMALLLLNVGCQSKVDALQTAPDFSLKDVNGNDITLSQFKGRIVVLDFWATWCPPCRMSIPELTRLQKEFRSQGLVVIGVSLDDPVQASNLFLKAFMEKFDMNYKVLRYDMKVMKDYFGADNPAIPTMFVIDRDGKIRNKIVGYRHGMLKKSIEALLQ